MVETSVAPEPTDEELAEFTAAQTAFDNFGNWRRQYRHDMVRSAWFWRGAILGLIGGGVWGVLSGGMGEAWEYWEKVGKGADFGVGSFSLCCCRSSSRRLYYLRRMPLRFTEHGSGKIGRLLEQR
jgi:hypothetical protein